MYNVVVLMNHNFYS